MSTRHNRTDDRHQTGAPTPEPASTARPRSTWIFLAIAIVVFLIGLGGGAFQGKLGQVQKNDNSSFLPDSADSTKVANEQERFSSVQSIPGFVVYQRDGGLTTADKQKIAADLARFRAIAGVAGDQVAAPQFSQKDDGVAATSVPLVGKQDGRSVQGDDLVKAENKVIDTARAGAPSGLHVHSAGAGGILVAFIGAFDGLDSSLLLSAGLVVIVILLFVYRSPVLWFFPLFSSVLALGAAALVIYPLAKSGTITLNGQSQGILSVLVIGAGTDYALLLVSRYREELHVYDSRLQAMTVAWKAAAQPIGASAATVILGLICLTFADLNSTAGLGPVCAIGIACTVVVMLTVLPVLLVISGRWIFWPRRPQVDHHTDIETTHGRWGRIAKWVGGHHRPAWIGASVLLVACLIAITGLKTGGLSTADGFTTTPDAITGQHVYDANFNKGAGAPAVILARADTSAAVIAAVRQVPGVDKSQVCIATDFGAIAAAVKGAAGNPAPAASLFDTNGCARVAAQVHPQAGQTLINATLTSSYDSQAAYDTIKHIRSAVGGVTGAHAFVGGQSAVNLDVQDASRHDRNLIIPLVLLVILIVLGLVLRSLVAPLILIATVVLSFTASLGVSALFFNHVFDFKNADPSFPLFAFVFLVALGIDYNIFLMTRVREESVLHGTREGIVRGLAVTGGVITSAGIVLAATFVVLGVLPIVFLAQIGFTVAFGVLLDTVVVRSILVPALSYDIGKKIWWPSKLAAASARD